MILLFFFILLCLPLPHSPHLLLLVLLFRLLYFSFYYSFFLVLVLVLPLIFRLLLFCSGKSLKFVFSLLSSFLIFSHSPSLLFPFHLSSLRPTSFSLACQVQNSYFYINYTFPSSGFYTYSKPCKFPCVPLFTRFTFPYQQDLKALITAYVLFSSKALK